MSAFKPSFALNAVKFLLPAVIIGILVWRIEPDQWQQLTDQPKHYGLLFAAFLIALMDVPFLFPLVHPRPLSGH